MMARPFRSILPAAVLLALTSCGEDEAQAPQVTAMALAPPVAAATPTPTPTPDAPPTTAVTKRAVAQFELPWAMVFLPDGRLLVTEKPGRLQLVTPDGGKTQVSGVPTVFYDKQIGLLDVVLDPRYANNRRIWLSYAEPGADGQRLAVARATLNLTASPRLTGLTVIWRATPDTTGGQPGGRLAFAPKGGSLFVATGERQRKTPAQDLSGTLGKIVHISLTGAAANGNPFAGTSGARAEIWSLGHRNPYGLVFADDGRLFENEMGPMGGDEFNLINPGRNYGWPNVSEGDNYDGTPIPRHSTNRNYLRPLISWTPVIAPGGMIQYRGTRFTGWTGDFVIAGLQAKGLVRVRVTGHSATELSRLPLGARIREVEEAPDGRMWVLTDGPTGQLIELTPR